MKTQNTQYSRKTSNYNDICTETHGLPNPAWVSSSHITNTKMGPEKWQRWNTSSPKPLGLTACPDETREISPPTSLLDDSQRGSQERGSKVLSLQTRAEQSPRSGKARFPGPTPPSLPSAVLLRSSPSEPPSFRRSDGPFPAPVTPQGDPAPRSSPCRGTTLPATPVKDQQTSGSSVSRGTAPSPSLHSPATSATLPTHFRPATGSQRGLPGSSAPSVRACVRASPEEEQCHVRLVPPGGRV